jgi:hypothetical protein
MPELFKFLTCPSLGSSSSVLLIFDYLTRATPFYAVLSHDVLSSIFMASEALVTPRFKACLKAESLRFGSRKTIGGPSRDRFWAWATKKGAVPLSFTFEPCLTLVTNLSNSYLGD